MKKLMVVLAMTGLLGSTLFSMEPEVQVQQKASIDEQGFAYNMSRLPKELRQLIVTLLLQLEIGKKWGLSKKIIADHFVLSVAFSPDGKSVLFQSGNEARLWDVTTGKELLHKGSCITSIAFSPEGKTVLTGSWDDPVSLWDVTTGKKIQQFTGHTGSVCQVAFSPDGKTILTGSYDETARLWDVTTGKELHQFAGHTDHVKSVAFSPDGRTVLTESRDGAVRLWNIATGEKIQQFTGCKGFLNSAVFSPEGKTVFLVSEDITIAILCDIDTGKRLKKFTGGILGITSVAFSPDGKIVLIGSHNGKVCLWDVETGQELQQFSEQGCITSVAFSPTGTLIALASHNLIVPSSQDQTGSTLSLWELNYALTFTPEQKKKALRIYLEKRLYTVLTGISQEEPSCKTKPSLDDDSQIELCTLL